MDTIKTEVVFESSILLKKNEQTKSTKSATVKKESYHEIYY